MSGGSFTEQNLGGEIGGERERQVTSHAATRARGASPPPQYVAAMSVACYQARTNTHFPLAPPAFCPSLTSVRGRLTLPASVRNPPSCGISFL